MTVRRTGRARVLLAALALLPLTACGSNSPASTEKTTLTVFAAASLTSTFEQLGTAFEKAQPGVSVEFNFLGSSDLVAQIDQGAPADVFASADTANMDKLVAADLAAGTPVAFASNTLEIAVPPGNPAGVSSLQDLSRSDVTLVVCAPEVPCGAAAQQVATAAGVTLTPVSEEQQVTDVLTKVSTGEADAGLVYKTDVQGAGKDVEGIEFPEAASVVNVYPITVVKGSKQATLAGKFVDLVTGAEGQSVLQAAGFAAAP